MPAARERARSGARKSRRACSALVLYCACSGGSALSLTDSSHAARLESWWQVARSEWAPHTPFLSYSSFSVRLEHSSADTFLDVNIGDMLDPITRPPSTGL
eukprot:1176412-Prorocentrum_minimum.AAC.2